MYNLQTISDVQSKILEQTGIKTSVKKGAGSLKDYFIFSPMFQNGSYPEFPFDWRRIFISGYPSTEPATTFANGTQIHIHCTVLEGEAVQYKKERKPKPVDESKVMKGWGSKNSQIRLDKATARYAKALRRGENRATYY